MHGDLQAESCGWLFKSPLASGGGILWRMIHWDHWSLTLFVWKWGSLSDTRWETFPPPNLKFSKAFNPAHWPEGNTRTDDEHQCTTRPPVGYAGWITNIMFHECDDDEFYWARKYKKIRHRTSTKSLAINKNVCYRKRIVSQHSCHQVFGPV